MEDKGVGIRLKTSALPWLYLVLGLLQTAHSAEEVLAGLWKGSAALYSALPFLPQVSWSAQGFAAANLTIVALLLALSPFPFMNSSWAWRIVRVIAGIEILNGLNHVSAALIIKAYFPGCVSALFLLAVGILLLFVSRGKHEHRKV